MADVFEAEDTLLNRKVAVKVLHANFASDDAFVTRFRREAQAAANLSHPNIVAIYDWGQDSGTYFMVMELIKGKTLRDVLREDGAILPRRAAEIAAETAAALSVAHQHGVYHRDVKPGNIMLTDTGAVKVTDFGIARALDDSEELTRTGAVIGTATYFSPEQAQGLPADQRSDVYSLGVVLYEMLAGRPPFSGESPVAVAYQHVSEHAVPAHNVNADAPVELSAIASHAIQKRADDRYQSADEMRADLMRYLGGVEPMAAGVVSAAAATAMLPPPIGVPAGGEAPPRVPTGTQGFDAPLPERSQTGYWAAVGGLIVVLGLGIWLLMQLLSGGDGAADMVVIPDLVDVEANQAFETLQKDLGLKVLQKEENSNEIAAGRVTRTVPPAGESVPLGEFVTVYVSLGAEQFGVPNLLGENIDIARARLKDQGFTEGTISYKPADDVDENIVINQSPPGGTNAPPGTAVDLVVSLGPESIEVPDVSGKSTDTAILELARAGFTNIEPFHEFSQDVPLGFVVGTNPAAGQEVPKEATILLIVSDGPEPVAVPDLVGKTQAAAQSEMSGLGLVMILSTETVEVPFDSDLVGNIAGQNRDPGDIVDVGTSVTVKLGVVAKVVVPDLFQRSLEAAESAAGVQGLLVDISVVDPPVSTPDPALDGKVATQNPLAGTTANQGSIITVVLYQTVEATTTTTTTTTTTP